MNGEVFLISRTADLADGDGMRVLIDTLPEPLRQHEELTRATLGTAYVPETCTLHLVCSTGERVAGHAISPVTVMEANGIYQRLNTTPLDLRQNTVEKAIDAVLGVTWHTMQ